MTTISSKRSTPHSLQTCVAAKNCECDHEIYMRNENVANRLFQLIFHRSLCRSISHHVKRTISTAATGLNTTLVSQSTDITEFYHEQKMENSRCYNRTTTAFGVDNREMNHDNLYVSPVKYKAKLSIKSLVTPQVYLDTMLEKRGYSTERYYVHESGYYNLPTAVQQLSYHPHVIDLVRRNNVEELQALFTAGLSNNPANAHGEGLIHLACRIGAADVVKMMIESGSDVQVSDDYGRTPLHDACWSAQLNFDIIELLLKVDPQMLYMMDVRGACPLSYVSEQDYDEWIHFFKSKHDVIWPQLGKEEHTAPPSLTLQLPNTRPVKNPHVVLPSAFIALLASGRMHPMEVMFLCQTYEDDEDLHSFVDEEMSFNSSSFDEDRFDFSTLSLYDDVSSLHTARSYDENDASLVAAPSPKDSDCSGTTYDRPSQMKHPIFILPPCPQLSNSLDGELMHVTDQKVAIGSVFEPAHPKQGIDRQIKSHHQKHNADKFSVTDVVRNVGSDRSTIQLLNQGTW